MIIKYRKCTQFVLVPTLAYMTFLTNLLTMNMLACFQCSNRP